MSPWTRSTSRPSKRSTWPRSAWPRPTAKRPVPTASSSCWPASSLGEVLFLLGVVEADLAPPRLGREHALLVLHGKHPVSARSRPRSRRRGRRRATPRRTCASRATAVPAHEVSSAAQGSRRSLPDRSRRRPGRGRALPGQRLRAGGDAGRPTFSAAGRLVSADRVRF